MEAQLAQYWAELTGRVDGPMSFRLVIQPLVATFLGVRAGMRDARVGAPIYGWSLISNPAHRRDLAHDGWKDIGKVFILAVVLDIVYELIVFRELHLGQPMIMGLVLVLPAYLLTRGPVNRLLRRTALKPTP